MVFCLYPLSTSLLFLHVFQYNLTPDNIISLIFFHIFSSLHIICILSLPFTFSPAFPLPSFCSPFSMVLCYSLLFLMFVYIYIYIYIHTQGVSRLVDITAVGDFLGLCDQKSSYKHVSDFGRLRSYGHFLIPVHALV